MNPPRYMIEKMLAGGQASVIASIACLGAAWAIKHSQPVEHVTVDDPETSLSEQEKTDLMDLARMAYDSMKDASQDEIDCAIAMYTEHLRAAGYAVEYAGDHAEVFH